MRSRSSRSALGLLLSFAVALCAGFGLRGVPPASAHHSFAMYDQTKVVVITGSVKEFQWSNPHALVWLFKDPTGSAPKPGAGAGAAAAGGEAGELWSIELPTSPGVLRKLGWTKHSLEPGDRVAQPCSDGSPPVLTCRRREPAGAIWAKLSRP